jgi:hypothetical protein
LVFWVFVVYKKRLSRTAAMQKPNEIEALR